MLRIALVLIAASCGRASPASPSPRPSAEAPTPGESAGPEELVGTRAAVLPREGLAVAVFAGGCFWCMEKPFEQLDGVGEVLSGYTGGSERAPTYEQVSSHSTGHFEAVRIVYDPTRVHYEQLLDVFWHNIDPTQGDGQFCDRGHQYQSAIFVNGDEERRLAEASKTSVAEQLDAPIVTEIRDAATFWIAEAYHQDFYRTNPSRYQSYRSGCGRDARLQALWGETSGH